MGQGFASLSQFLLILNPFALALYLLGVIDDLDKRQFMGVMGTASLISFAVFMLVALTGDQFLVRTLKVRPSALRIFGGVIFFVIAYNYATKGYRAAEMLRGNIEELPSAIAMPYMIGAGTITQSMIVGRRHGVGNTALILFLGIVLTYLMVVGFKLLRDHMRQVAERVFDRYVNILARINGLLVGTISVEMVVSGIQDLWLQQE